jgi:hypothetical protein
MTEQRSLGAFDHIISFQPYRRYLPDEPGRDDGPPAIDLIYGNTADHFADHLAWIETLVDRAA